MRTAWIISLLIVLNFTASAQTNAQDWTKTDCAGNSFHLFDMLDNGEVVILDFVHVGCTPCIIGTTYLGQIYNDYELSHPGRVKLLCISYDNIATCNEMNAWGSTYDFPYPKFINGENDVNYYGGMGMPTVVILAAADHAVYYNHKGFSSSEDLPARNAIDNALNAPLATTGPSADDFQIQCIPSTDGGEFIVRAENLHQGEVEFSIHTLQGVRVHRQSIAAGSNASIEVKIPSSAIPSGLYFVRVQQNGISRTARFWVGR